MKSPSRFGRQPNVLRKRSADARIAAEPKPSAASGGNSEAKAGNRKERLRDYASFPDAEGDYCDSVNTAFIELELNCE